MLRTDSIMGFCEHHTCFFEGETCYKCYRYNEWVESEKRKKQEAAERRYQKKATYIKSKNKRTLVTKYKPDNRLTNYRDQADRAFSQIIRAMYDNPNGFSSCSTCDKIKETFGGLYKGLHAGHFFPKGKYWHLRYRIENSLPQCYNCNVNNQAIIPAMRPKLVKIFGEEKIKKLEDDSNFIPSKKDKEGEILWYKNQLNELRKIIKNNSV